MRPARLFVSIVAAVLTLTLGFSPPAHAAYYNKYKTIALTPDTHGTTASQAFAATANYFYSIKINKNNKRAVIYRISKDGKKTQKMTNLNTDKKFITKLHHANDMTVAKIDGKRYFFVVTMAGKGGYQLIKLRVQGDGYRKVASYKLRYNGEPKGVSGIDRVKVVGSKVTFIFKSGRKGGSGAKNGSVTYTAEVSDSLRSKSTIKLTKAFRLKTAGAKVDGKEVNLAGFNNQSVYYDAGRQTLYYPMTRKNVSIVLVYRNVTPHTRGTRTPDPKLSFRITSRNYKQFEIEGVGFSGKHLYFNTNRSRNLDGIHMFKNYERK
ncbi:MAG: hypothetical protein ACK5LN_08025 [Propioniciclava sp.]